MFAARILACIVSPLAIAFLAVPAAAQCPQPDGLLGPCCATATANLPGFPAQFVPGTAICYDACNANPQLCMQMDLGPPAFLTCTSFDVGLKVIDCGSGATILGSTLRLDYTRTWLESGPAAGQQRQVWRFMAKGDMFLSGPGPACAIPACLTFWPTAFYYGYVDYALDCGTSTWESAAMLFHPCDLFTHQQPLSDKPGTYHPGRSYALVMPHTTANPFLPTAVPSPGGAVLSEAMRSTGPVGTPFCTAEDLITSGSLAPLISACICPLGFAPTQLTASRLIGTGSCPDATGVAGSFMSLNFFPTVPWFELMSFSIGRWTTPATFPGQEEVWADEGLFRYRDVCAAIPGTTFGNFTEIHYGATTRGGYSALPIDPTQILSPRFVDLASNFSHHHGTGPIIPPVLGSVRPTRHLIYLNVF